MAASKKPPAHHKQNGAQRPVKDESEFDRFKALADKLIRVPKSELDEKRKSKS